jgi:quercetin dioxygenase-like cupin family protein
MRAANVSAEQMGCPPNDSWAFDDGSLAGATGRGKSVGTYEERGAAKHVRWSDRPSFAVVNCRIHEGVAMHRPALLFVTMLFAPLVSSSQTRPPAVPLGGARPETPGITRTVIRDDAKATVTRVRFTPGAMEPLHTHPYDVILVPVFAGAVEWMVGDRKATSLSPGEVQFVPRDVPHQLKYSGTGPFELIAIGLK